MGTGDTVPVGVEVAVRVRVGNRVWVAVRVVVWDRVGTVVWVWLLVWDRVSLVVWVKVGSGVKVLLRQTCDSGTLKKPACITWHTPDDAVPQPDGQPP